VSSEDDFLKSVGGQYSDEDSFLADVGGQLTGDTRGPVMSQQPDAVSRITDFSPDAIAETTGQLRSDRRAKLNSIGPGTSATRGLAQGLTANFADELTGLGEGAYRAATEPDTSFGDAYTQARDESRAAYGDAQEANPMSYTAGEVGGGLATLAVPGLGAGTAAKGAAGLGRTILTGAAQGGLTAAGASQAETPMDIAKDAAKGAGIGAAVPAGLGALGKAGGYVAGKLAPDKLSAVAERMGFAALRPTKGVATKLGEEGKINEIGRAVLDNPDIPTFANTSQLAAGTKAAAQKAATDLQGVYDKVSQSLGKDVSQVGRDELLSAIQKGTVDPARAKFGGELAPKILDDVSGRIDAAGLETLDINQLRALRGKLQKLSKPDKLSNPTEQQELLASAAGDINDLIYSKADEAAEIVGGAGGEGLKAANRGYHIAQTGADIVRKRDQGDLANRLIGASSYGTGLTAGTVAGWDDFKHGDIGSGLVKSALGFAGGAAANKFVLGREKMIAARALDSLSRGIKKVDMTKNIVKSATTGRLAQTRFGGAIMQAAQSGDRGKLAATNYVLSEQYPEYRQAKDADEEEQEMSHE